MATVAIFISDLENGVDGVQVDVRSDEEISEDGELTTAQGLGAATVMFLQTLINVDEEDEPASLELPAGVETDE